jgi:hypothetical protein
MITDTERLLLYMSQIYIEHVGRFIRSKIFVQINTF